MSTGQNAVMLCGWGVKAGWLILYVDINLWVAGKLCDPSLTRAMFERFRDEYRTHCKAPY